MMTSSNDNRRPVVFLTSTGNPFLSPAIERTARGIEEILKNIRQQNGFLTDVGSNVMIRDDRLLPNSQECCVAFPYEVIPHINEKTSKVRLICTWQVIVIKSVKSTDSQTVYIAIQKDMIKAVDKPLPKCRAQRSSSLAHASFTERTFQFGEGIMVPYQWDMQITVNLQDIKNYAPDAATSKGEGIKL